MNIFSAKTHLEVGLLDRFRLVKLLESEDTWCVVFSL